MYRIWSHGFTKLTDASVLRNLRTAIVEDVAGQKDNLRLLAPDPAAVKGRQRCAFTAHWTDWGTGADVHALYVVEAVQPPMAAWSVTAVSDKRWLYRMSSPGERPAFTRVREAAGLTGGFHDQVGVKQSDSLTYLDAPPEHAEEAAKIFAKHITSPDRTTGLFLISERAEVALNSWWGLLTTVLVSEDIRRHLNNVLPPSRAIPSGGARLFAVGPSPHADQVFNLDDLKPRSRVAQPAVQVSNLADLVPGARVVQAAIQQMVSTRQQTPLPEDLVADAAIAEWWTSHPADLLLAQQQDAMQTQLGQLQEQLDSEQRRLVIVTRQRDAVQRKHDQLHEENVALREEVATAADPEAVAELRTQLAAVEGERDLYVTALAETEAERDDLARLRGALARKLALHAGEQVAEIEDEATARPEHASFAELLANAREAFPALAITADPGPADGLDRNPKAAAWRRKTWDTLATLNAYAEDRRAVAAGDREPGSWCTDVLAYLKAGMPGALISANSVSLGESDAVLTNDRFRQARVFPVHPATDESEQALFIAHVRIERFKSPAPRLYFLDDVSRTGVVYIGYLGPHLPTQRTN